jgi:CRP-like cAMP-binding protein
MRRGELGKVYADGECVVRQGEKGHCMHMVQRGQLEVVLVNNHSEIVVSVLRPGDVFGEMALFTKETRSATVRARGKARVLTIDKRGFMKRMHEDPSLAFHILQNMSKRIQKLNEEITRLRGS